MLSEQAAQNVTVTSRNGLVDLSTYALQLHTKNGMAYQMYSNNDESLRYRTFAKERQLTILSIVTVKAVRLPIIDIDLINYFSTNDSWTVSIGPVCFS